MTAIPSTFAIATRLDVGLVSADAAMGSEIDVGGWPLFQSISPLGRTASCCLRENRGDLLEGASGPIKLNVEAGWN